MKWISINSKQFSISKYLVYFILMGLLLKLVAFKIWYAITYTRTKGIVERFTFSNYQGSHGSSTKYYPVLNFPVKNDTFICIGSSFEHDEMHPGDAVAVIYDARNPDNSFVYTFLGFWAPPLVYVIPFSILLSLAFLGLDSIPTNLTIKF